MNTRDTEKIENCFYKLYIAFMDKVVKDRFDKSIIFGISDGPVIDFQGYTHSRLCELVDLKEYKELCALVKKILAKEVHPYFIFGYMFSDVYMSLNPISPQYRIVNNIPNIQSFCRNPDILMNALSTGSMTLDMKIDNSFLIVLQGVKIQKQINIPGIGVIKPLGNDLDLLKNNRMFKFDWGHVYTGLYVSNIDYLEDDYIKVLLTIFRLFKKGDIRYLNKYQKVENYATGYKYLKYKNSSSNNDYSEESAKHRGDALSLYKLDQKECDDFIYFYNEMFKPLQKMKYSCEFFNRAVLSPHYIKDLFLFIVIESFFSDVSIEISYRVSLYVTRLLNENVDFFKLFKDLYNLRSKLAHGDPDSAKKIRTRIYKNHATIFRKYSDDNQIIEGIVKALFINLARINWDPKKSGSTMRDLLINIE